MNTGVWRLKEVKWYAYIYVFGSKVMLIISGCIGALCKWSWFIDLQITSAGVIATVLIGVSLSEAHTSELQGGFSLGRA